MRLLGSQIGQFRIDEHIGQGGMGNVYRGYDENLQRPVAIKVLRSHTRSSPEARARFVREARILSRLRHPSICQIYDLVEHRDTYLLVMELVEGVTLSRERLASFEHDRKLELAQELAEVLIVAHRAGVVHRDLKPDNLMLTRDGELKVLDFGIARRFGDGSKALSGEGRSPSSGPVTPSVRDATATILNGLEPATEAELDPDPDLDPTLAHPLSLLEGSFSPGSIDLGATFVTEAHSLVGTLSYMSPEQAQNREVTPAGDMFSFGILLREMLSGSRAYPDDLTPVQQHQYVIEGRTLPLKGVEPDLARLIEALTDLSPSQRPSASAVRDRLAWIRGQPERRRLKRRRRIGAAVALALVLGAASLILHSRFQAQRAVAVASEFALQARDVEWLMRAAALSPAQDIRPLRREVRRRMDALKGQMQTLGDDARGPGLHALGRSAAALGDLEAARGSLEEAWELGYRPSGVAADLGRTLLRLYDRRAEELRRRLTPEERREPLAELDRELRAPGLRFLRGARDTPDAAVGSLLRRETAGLDDAVIALHEDRWDDAVTAAEHAAAEQPRLYEAHAIQGLTHFLRGHEQLRTGAYDDLARGLEASRAAWQRAAGIGRGDLDVYRGLCRLAELEIRASIHGTGGDIEPFLDYGLEACETGLLIDPDDAETAGLLSILLFRRAESGTDPTEEDFERAADWAHRTLAMDPELVWVWNTLGNTYLAWADRRFYLEGGDPTELARQALNAYRSALDLAPASPRLWNAIGNVSGMQAEFAFRHGKDPGESLRTAREAYEKALELQPDFDFVYANLLQNLQLEARYRAAQGVDPKDVVDEGLAVAEQALALNPNMASCLSELNMLLTERARYLVDTPTADEDPLPILDRALENGRKSLEIHPDNFYTLLGLAGTHLVRARALQESGAPSQDLSQDLREARRRLDQARELDPEHQDLPKLDREWRRLTSGSGGS